MPFVEQWEYVQEFGSYSAYRQHVESMCEARVRACHICGKTFISVARLNTHVQESRFFMFPAKKRH
jgi:hypothetical protein